jgi:hypothetical protein
LQLTRKGRASLRRAGKRERQAAFLTRTRGLTDHV